MYTTNNIKGDIFMEKYTIIYLRVSTDKQFETGSSIQYQEDVCWKKAKEFNEPDHLIKIYREHASGEDIDRPEMNKIRDEVAAGKVKRIIIVHPDRLSRNMVDRLVVCNEFEKYGVSLVFLDVEYKDSEEGKLFFNIQSSIAQYELALIKKRTRRGSITKSQNGKIMGFNHVTYGYKFIRKKDAKTKKEENTLEINTDEAHFVKLIFQWYVYDKLTMREIGEKLCSLNAIPRRKKIPEWSASSIQNILKNETYIGKFYYNRRHTQKVKGEKTVSGKPKRTYEVRDKDEWIEIPVPAIIDPATFYLAQEQREKNAKHSGNVKHEYLLRKKIRCGHCGNKYASFTTTNHTKNKKGEISSTRMYRRYRCTNRNARIFGDDAKRCNSNIINADVIENYLWENLIMNIINNTDKVLNDIRNKYEKPSQEVESAYNLLKYQITKLKEEEQRIINLYKKAYIDEDEMERDMGQIRSKIKEFKKEMEKYEQQIFNIDKSELNIEMLKEKIKKVKKAMENQDELSYKLKRQLVDYFIDEIILKWNEDGSLNVTTVGAINYFDNNEQLGELSTKHQTVIDTTNAVFNILFETLFTIDTKGRDKKLHVLKQNLKIG